MCSHQVVVVNVSLLLHFVLMVVVAAVVTELARDGVM